MKDIGTYQCVAENEFGKTYSQSALLMVRKGEEEEETEEATTDDSAAVTADTDSTSTELPSAAEEDVEEVVNVEEAAEVNAENREPRKDENVFLVFPEKMDMSNVDVIDPELRGDSPVVEALEDQ